MPPKTLSFCTEKFLSFLPAKNPILEFINVITAIKRAGLRILVPHRESVIPAEKASIEVAIPIKIKHFKSMQADSGSIFLFDSIINLNPKYEKIKNTIKSAYGRI